MSFLRPEAAAALWRWREALAGACLAVLGAWGGAVGNGIGAIVAILLMVAGIALGAAGWQRARFRNEGGGPGVVLLDEGQITYLGPVIGGTLAIGEIEAVVLDPLARGGPAWELCAARGPLRIPADADGAEGLFDAFATLADFDTEAMLAALADPGRARRTLWRRLH